jgi:hypothetical protein
MYHRQRHQWLPLRYYLLALLLTLGLTVASPPRDVAAQSTVLDRIDVLLDTTPNISDDFSADQEFWRTLYDGDTSRYFKSGRFYIVVDIADTVAYARGDTTVDDFYAEVDTFHIAGNLSNQLGLIFRYVDENNFYFFAIGHDGYYALLKLEDNSWSNLVSWTESDAVNSGSAARNRVAVLVEGPEITVLVNDEIVAEVEDHSFTTGQIALTAGTYEQPGVEVAFDNFALWRLGEPIVDSPVAPPPLNDLSDMFTDLDLILLEFYLTEPDYAENFTDGDGGWDVFETENVLTQHSDGALVMLVRAPQRLGASVYPRQVVDFYLEVDVEHVSGPIDAEFGVVFREVDEGNYYFYAVTSEGYYSLWRKRNNEWQTLIDWAFSEALETGEGAYNTLGVLAQGERIVLAANETVLAEATDSAFSEGTIAMVVGTFDEGDVTIAFDGVYIWDIESDGPVLPPVQRRTEDEDADAVDEPDQPEEPVSDYDVEARLADILATPPIFHDDFRRNTGEWDLPIDDEYSFTYRQRAILGVLDKTEWVAWTALLRDLTDYYFEVDATQLNDTEEASYGIIFRLQDTDNFYQFSISIYGTYAVWKSVGGEWEALVDWVDNPAVNTGVGVTNRLGVLVEGANIAVVVNGEVIATLVDSDLDSGTIGLAIETFEEGGVEVAFDNVELWDLTRQ